MCAASCCWSTGMNARMPLTTPHRLTPNTHSRSPRGTSQSGSCEPPTPALLHSRCTPPNASTAASRRASTAAGSATSVTTGNTVAPSRASSATAELSAGSSTSAMTTRMPSAAKRRLSPSPIPLAAPVTTATRPGATTSAWAIAPPLRAGRALPEPGEPNDASAAGRRAARAGGGRLAWESSLRTGARSVMLPTVATPPPAGPTASDAVGAWSPLRIATFRALWLAQLGSMVGTWMQTVGAQWLLIDEPNAPTLVSLVQTASLLPMLLLALPAGVLADSFDRRRLLIGVQLGTVVVGTALTVATFLGDITPQVLLALTFLLGCGQAMSMPPWQALIPDIVPTEQVRAAAALGAVAMNVARAVGPALAGLLITQVDVAMVFALNTTSYAVLAFVLVRWAPSGQVSGDVPERFVPA